MYHSFSRLVQNTLLICSGTKQMSVLIESFNPTIHLKPFIQKRNTTTVCFSKMRRGSPVGSFGAIFASGAKQTKYMAILCHITCYYDIIVFFICRIKAMALYRAVSSE